MNKVKLKIASVDGDNDDYTDVDVYKINSWGADLSFRELAEMYQEGDIVLPEMQRKYVWDKHEASRFVDSILLGLPVPSIFLANDENDKKIIVDGYQRIKTIVDYLTGIWSGDGSIFHLSRSGKVSERWRGKTFTQLSEQERRKIKTTTIHAIIFEQASPKDDDTSLFQIFERINTSGRSLLPQEIRNAVCQGSFNKLLIELNKYSSWRILFSGDDEEDPRMRDIEYILRFFALANVYPNNETESSIMMKKFLDTFMKKNRHISEQEQEIYRYDFKKTMDNILDSLGENAFRKQTNSSRANIQFHPTIFDSIAVAFLKKDSIIFDDAKEAKIRLLNDTEYIGYISERTTRNEAINGRIYKAIAHFFGS